LNAAGEEFNETHSAEVLFCPADESHSRSSPNEARKALKKHLNFKRAADATTELKTAGFDINARDGGVRALRYRFAGHTTATLVAFK
jgi:hypothetical protein